MTRVWHAADTTHVGLVGTLNSELTVRRVIASVIALVSDAQLREPYVVAFWHRFSTVRLATRRSSKQS